MAVLLNRIKFTEMVDQAIDNGGDLLAVQMAIDAKRRAIIIDGRNELPKATRRQFNTLQTLFKEQLDVVAELIAARDPAAAVNATTLWRQNECRFYPEPNGTVTCKCGDYEIMVGDDFPASMMLVCTPLTRLARKAQLEAMMTGKIYCGHGPPGTGKTETVKDTCHMLGLNAVAVSTDDLMTHPSLGCLEEAKKSGPNCPIVFDEFNRASAENMERIIAACGDTFTCVTMNPGCPGRHEIPEILRAKMVDQPFSVPDMTVIIQVLLGSEGITDCDALGAKVFACVQACKEKCSKQSHYDFGLRFIKKLVDFVGLVGRTSGFDDETKLVATAAGTQLFKQSSTEDKEIVRAEVREAFGHDLEVPGAWRTAGLDATAAMVASTAQTRHGVCVVGCADPDACIAAIERAMGAESIIVEGDAAGLHGDDAPFTAAYKAAMEKTTPVNVVLKMPLDADALEPLNTVLDDNKILTTPNGGRFGMTRYMRIIILTENCGAWTPANVSRVGSVFAHI